MAKSTYSVGIDLHKRVVQICVLSANGENPIYERHALLTSADGVQFVKGLMRWKQGGRFVVEAVGMNRWLVRDCRAKGLDIVVADPAKLQLKKSGKKTDRRDAYELARRLYLGDIDRDAITYFPTEEQYAGRKLERVRHQMCKLRLMVVNNIRAMLRAYNREEPDGVLQCGVAIQELRAVRFEQPDLTAAFQANVQLLEDTQRQVDVLTERLVTKVRPPKEEKPAKKGKSASKGDLPARTAEADSAECIAIRHVADLPLVGPVTAPTIVYELGDVHRFRKTRAVTAYGGLAARVCHSADTAHNGRLTKSGSSELRWVLVQWAVRMLAQNDLVKEWAAPYLRRMHKNKVRVALARRLLIGVYKMLRTGEVFSLERCLGTAA